MTYAERIEAKGHNQATPPSVTAQRVVDFVEALIASAEYRGFPRSRPRTCRMHVHRVASARSVLASSSTVPPAIRARLYARIDALEEAARLSGWTL